MESVALLSDTNWKLNMRRRELLKPDLNPPIHGCARKSTPSTKLFRDDLSKHLKDMSEAKKAGQQMHKASSHAHKRGSAHSQWRRFARFKPCDRSMVLFANSHLPSLFWGTAVRHQTPLRKKPQPQATKLNTCSSTSM